MAVATALRVIYVPFLGTAWSLTFDDGESENRRGWTTSSATFQDVASVREDFVKLHEYLLNELVLIGYQSLKFKERWVQSNFNF